MIHLCRTGSKSQEPAPKLIALGDCANANLYAMRCGMAEFEDSKALS
jgi:hypothetical protein